MSRLRLPLAVLVAGLVAIFFAAAFPDSILAGDVVPYRAHMENLFAGRLPYFEFPFEHLPLMLLPMATAWIIGGSFSLQAYAFAFAAVSIACLMATIAPLGKVERLIEAEGLTERWIVLTVPLLPLLVFRNDSFVVLLGVAGIWLALVGRRGWSLVVLTSGILAKVWPAVWAGAEWRRGHRGRAAYLVVAGLCALGIMATPSVQSIQDPQGLHTGTLMGSAVGFWRSIVGADLNVTVSATAYIDAPGWTLGVNLLVGAILAFVVVRRLSERSEARGGWILTGGLLGAGLLASPYLSTQYVAWLGPFFAVRRNTSWILGIINVANLVLITAWHQLFEGRVWWWGLMFVRNLGLIALVLVCVLVPGSRSAWRGRSLTGHSEPGLVR